MFAIPWEQAVFAPILYRNNEAFTNWLLQLDYAAGAVIGGILAGFLIVAASVVALIFIRR
jgi:hypothetical protein